MMKKILLLTIFILSAAISFAGGKGDVIFQTIDNKSIEEFKTQISKNSDLIYATRGNEKQTVLMAACENDFDEQTIKSILKYGAKSKVTTKEDKTALMYACQYNSHPKVIELLIDDDAFLTSSKKAKILKTDKSGKNSIDYANENPARNEILPILYSFVPQDEINNENTDLTDVNESQTETHSQQSQSIENTQPSSPPPQNTTNNEPANFIKNSQVSYQDGNKGSKIFSIVESGTLEEIQSALKNSPEAQSVVYGENQETLLMAACTSNRDIEVIKAIVKKGVNINKKDINGKTTLMYAAQYNTNPDVVEYIIENGFYIRPTEKFEIILNVGVDTYNAMLKYAKKGKVLMRGKNGLNSIDYAQQNPNKDAILEVLNRYAMFVDQKVSAKQFANVMKQEDFKDFVETINNEPEIDLEELKRQEEEKLRAEEEAKRLAEEEALRLAEQERLREEEEAKLLAEEEALRLAEQERLRAEEEAKRLAEQQEKLTVNTFKPEYLFDYIEMSDDDEIPPEDPNFSPRYTYIQNADKKDLNGRTPLMLAAKEGNISLMENLIYSGANINAYDNDGWTPLMYASRFQSSEKAVDLLIKKGCDIKKKNNYGMSALTLAAGFSQNPKIVNLLLGKRSITENEVRSAFIFALTNDAPVATIDLFVQKGMKINIAYDGKTPLMYAAKSNKTTKIIDYLLKAGAKITYKSSEGKTAFQYAKENTRLPHDSVYWQLNSDSTAGEN